MAEKSQSPAASSSRSPLLAPALAFFAAVLVYLPSLRGEFIWNDPDYVTQPALASRGCEARRRVAISSMRRRMVSGSALPVARSTAESTTPPCNCGQSR